MFLIARADVLEPEVELVHGVVEGGARDADAAGFGKGLEPGRDVDAVAVEIVALDDDVAEIDADAELDAPSWRNVLVALGHAALDYGSAAQCVDDAGELDQRPVAHQLDDPAMAGPIVGSINSRRCALRRASVPASPAPMRRL